MCLCNFGALLSQCIGLFVPCDLTVSWCPLQCDLFVFFAVSCRVRSWQSLASGDILVSVDPADSILTFESEKITALSDLFWCEFSRCSVVRMASLDNVPHHLIGQSVSDTGRPG
jgi:hypothetical protein